MTITKKEIFKKYTCVHCNGSGVLSPYTPEEVEACESCGGENVYGYSEGSSKKNTDIELLSFKKGSGEVGYLQEIWIDEAHYLEAAQYTDDVSGKMFWGVEVNKMVEVNSLNKEDYPFSSVGEKVSLHLYQLDTNSKNLIYAYKKSKEKLINFITDKL